MVYNGIGQGFKSKPRGKPFVKGNKKGKIMDEIQPDSGHKTRVKRGDLKSQETPVAEVESQKENLLNKLPQAVMETSDQIIRDNLDSKKEEIPADEMVESIDFKNGENILSIRFSKRHNRMYRIQVFLNNETEVRPVTYTGASTGNSFWRMLKGALKK